MRAKIRRGLRWILSAPVLPEVRARHTTAEERAAAVTAAREVPEGITGRISPFPTAAEAAAVTVPQAVPVHVPEEAAADTAVKAAPAAQSAAEEGAVTVLPVPAVRATEATVELRPAAVAAVPAGTVS